MFSDAASIANSVLLAYLGKASFVLNKKKPDKAARVLILSTMLAHDKYSVTLYQNWTSKSCAGVSTSVKKSRYQSN